MSDLKRFQEFVKWFEELVFGTKKTSKTECKVDICCGGDCHTDIKPKRARGKKGRYLADDPKTKNYNEAYVGGKAPKDLLGLKKRKK
tara:strand:+ start:939 stop:1199 length:261 start_codon:yes stop_codon:yes gene_type:complete